MKWLLCPLAGELTDPQSDMIDTADKHRFAALTRTLGSRSQGRAQLRG